MKKIVSLLLICCMLFSLCSCSKITSIFSGGTEQSFSYPVVQMPKTIDPQIAASESELIIIENCMEGLVRLDEQGNVVPAIAKNWELSANGVTYTFYLNSNAVWNTDNLPEETEIEGFRRQITAQDFVFAVSRAVLKQTASPDFQSVSMIKNAQKIYNSGSSNTASLGVKALDDYTLQITLESPNSDFLTSLTGAVFMPCSESFFNYCAGRYGRQSKYFLSNGGFMLRSWSETNVVIKKNDAYTLSHPAKADAVTLYRDENAFESFKNNNYDALAVSDDNIDYALSDSSLSVQSYDDTVWTLALNCAGKLCESRQFRKALMSGFDVNALSSPEWAGQAKGVVPNICTAGGENYRENAASLGFVSYAPKASAAAYQAFCERYFAQEDTDELGTFELLCTAAFEKTAKQIVQSWQLNFGTGFEVKIIVLALEELKDAVSGGAYDAAILPISADTTDALVFLKKFATENDFSYQSAAYNQAINAGNSEVQKCVKCENLLLSDYLLYPLFTSSSYYVQRNTISGIYFYAFGGKVNFLNAERAK